LDEAVDLSYDRLLMNEEMRLDVLAKWKEPSNLTVMGFEGSGSGKIRPVNLLKWCGNYMYQLL
jgi:hypothetical protein